MEISSNLVEQKYVAFLDVLGFKEILKEKGNKLDKYFETVTDSLNLISDVKRNITSQIVSDSIILSCPINDEDFRRLLRAIQTIQYRCALENIWLRGAITIGDIHFDPNLNIVVGNGLSDAYLLESQEKYPRVILDPKIIESGGFQTKGNLIARYNLRPREQDGNCIYLIADIRNGGRKTVDDAIYVTFAERVAKGGIGDLEIVYNNIKSELYKGQKNYQKYLWLKNYFIDILRSCGTRYTFLTAHEFAQHALKFEML